MKKFLCLSFLAALAASGFAQSKTITNADLEKYRQKRLAAERDLRENYRAMGFPSPEEMERRDKEDGKELAESAERYRQMQYERAERQGYSDPQIVYYYPEANSRVYSGYYGLAPAYYYGNRYRKRNRYRRSRGPGYISNPIIRNNWLRQSAPMRRTYRGNFRTRRTRVRW